MLLQTTAHYLDRSIDCSYHLIFCIFYVVLVRIWSTFCQLSSLHYSSMVLNWIHHTICPFLFYTALKKDPCCRTESGILRQTYHHEFLLILILQRFTTIQEPLELKLLGTRCFRLCRSMLIRSWIFVRSLVSSSLLLVCWFSFKFLLWG